LKARFFFDGISIAGFSSLLGGIRRRRIRRDNTPPLVETSEALCFLAASAEVKGMCLRRSSLF
ncbi:hypothetical protein LINPERPRIM_LOCUS25246, partial [Linum perenne]